MRAARVRGSVASTGVGHSVTSEARAKASRSTAVSGRTTQPAKANDRPEAAMVARTIERTIWNGVPIISRPGLVTKAQGTSSLPKQRRMASTDRKRVGRGKGGYERGKHGGSRTL